MEKLAATAPWAIKGPLEKIRNSGMSSSVPNSSPIASKLKSAEIATDNEKARQRKKSQSTPHLGKPEKRVKNSLISASSSSTNSLGEREKVSDDGDVNCTIFEVEEWGSKRWIRVEVIEPVTLTSKNFLHLSTSFTTYLIRIETNHYAFSLPVSEVRRRYSEFCWLRAKLCMHHPNKVLPPLPPKHYFNITNFNQKIINERRYGLGKFLQRVFRSSVLLSDSALHLFLQTDLTTKEIDRKVSEAMSPQGHEVDVPLLRIHSSPESIKPRPQMTSRSVSLSSSPNPSDADEGHGSDDGREDYCELSSSEEEEIDVEN